MAELPNLKDHVTKETMKYIKIIIIWRERHDNLNRNYIFCKQYAVFYVKYVLKGYQTKQTQKTETVW